MKSEFGQLQGRKVLVLGGTGFIGSRLVEKLVVDCGAEVRVLVRNLSRACGIARFPVEIVSGNVENAEDVNKAVSGCDLVFQSTVPGTQNVLEACAAEGVARLVYLSSLMVYGITSDGDLDEKAERKLVARNPYSKKKYEAEALVFDYIRNRGLPAVILQPTGVYGPNSRIYCRDVVSRLSKERVILVNGGDGYFNPVYIDDLVTALLLAAVRDEALGEDFLISAAEPVTWQTFYGEFERIMGIDATVAMSDAEVRSWLRERASANSPKPAFRELRSVLREYPDARRRLGRTREALVLKRIVGPLIGKRSLFGAKSSKRRSGADSTAAIAANADPAGKPIGFMYANDIPFYASKTVARIDKARRLLGYEPQFDFRQGMEVTEAWLRWARLV